MILTNRQFLLLFKESKSEEEFGLRCAMLGLKPEAAILALAQQVKDYWHGQWQNGAEKQQVTVHDFFVEKQYVREVASMANLISAMVTFVTYGI